MLRTFGMTGRALARVALLSGLSAGLAGCGTSGGNLFGGGQTQEAAAQPAPGVGSPVHNALFGQPVQAGPQTLQENLCPRIEVRDGSNVWRQGGDGPTELRYQATITDLARECRIDGQTMIVKVGLEGRVLTGPKAEGSARLTLPIRVAVTRGLSQSVWTRLYNVPIDVPAGSPNVSFTQIEDQVSFPLPPPDELQTYVIFVGFDTMAQPRERGRGRQARQR
ncbi:hypothetical protein [Phreatobacter stygius]|uniref:Lipoprotein n=1 Tax=Phreatobacter stygius TaxID=1940610 RepID=A0A4D7BFB3_9HYPH|nr:hypothetical protein [Phreatobacter stygius]QCI66622.1 hypothetical protein E8M01_21745 [Phreatobacter stygius]